MEKRTVLVLIPVVMMFLAGCSNHMERKIQEWEEAYSAGKLTYYQLEHLKALQRNYRPVPGYYFGGTRYRHHAFEDGI